VGTEKMVCCQRNVILSFGSDAPSPGGPLTIRHAANIGEPDRHSESVKAQTALGCLLSKIP
jgi:hypothetical protein